MPDIVIKAENLGKKFIIGHQGKNESYTALRDVFARSARSLWTKTKDLLQGRPIIQGESLEEFWALKDVSFEVERGEAIGIIGRNGAGKSTLLKILSRIMEPSAGRVTIKGRVASLLEVGTGFHPELTGRENIYLNGAILGMSRAEVKRKFDEIVDFSGVERFLDTPVKRFSSGMYVRLAFAVAAHLEPEILVVDEVLAVGDAEFQKKCLGKMSEVAGEGRTVLFVSHNMTAIASLCNSGILLTNGEISKHGTSKEVISEYLDSQLVSDNGIIDLTKAIRRNSLEKSKFKWTGARVINSKGVETTTIEMLEPFELILTGFANEPIQNLIVGFGVISQLGCVLFNSHSVDHGIQNNYDKGIIEFKIKFNKNFLGPGSYTVDLGANGPKIVDWIPEAINITINEITTAGKTITRTNFSGVILHPCEWLLINK